MTKADDAAHVVSNCGAALAGCSGLARWLTENHDLLSSCGIIVGIVGVIFGQAVNVWFKRRELERNGEKAR